MGETLEERQWLDPLPSVSDRFLLSFSDYIKRYRTCETAKEVMEMQEVIQQELREEQDERRKRKGELENRLLCLREGSALTFGAWQTRLRTTFCYIIRTIKRRLMTKKTNLSRHQRRQTTTVTRTTTTTPKCEPFEKLFGDRTRRMGRRSARSQRA